jgi:hypothetical protein
MPIRTVCILGKRVKSIVKIEINFICVTVEKFEKKRITNIEEKKVEHWKENYWMLSVNISEVNKRFFCYFKVSF